jgi:hypothetical protein
MLGANPLVVHVETSAGKSFGETMNAIRLWLDSQKIQTTNFKIVPAANGYRRFEIAFRLEDEAELFRQQFASNDGYGLTPPTS